MLYNFFQHLDQIYDLPGSGMFQYISFRSITAFIVALLLVIYVGKPVIRLLQRLQIGEQIRNLGLEGQSEKSGTPTMGGVLILLAILVPTLLVARLSNIYILLMVISTVWCGTIGFLDDYIKVFRHNKEGLKGKFKIVGQVGLGIIVGTVMCFSEDVVVRENTTELVNGEHIVVVEDVKTTQTTIPFIKDNEFDYSWLTGGNQT
ncbi:MAG: phospho-N-acetylmuramoyl-pentapeptide-transferase, partial [Alistipes sp.]|nr:phospho-N-acetylmuramoyl-pentapeptide-transferase [Alistipes sp.]